KMPAGKFFLEIFAGVGHLRVAAAAAGLRVAVPIDARNGDHLDVTCKAVADVIIGWILAGRIWMVWLGTPCTSWTAALRRHRGSDGAGGQARDAAGLACARFTCRVLRACRSAGVQFVVENPRNSALWQWPPLVRFTRRAVSVSLEMCSYGAAWRKPTRLVGTLEGLERMGQLCPGHGRHVVLQGSVHLPGTGWRWRTSFASVYPLRFCRRLAGLCWDAAPSPAWRSCADARLDEQRGSQLAAARSSVVDEPFHLGALPRAATLGWESADGR
ncbi:unnamed protein product, partial [Prorocentrum cordatum]